jgi:hypothetical protein
VNGLDSEDGPGTRRSNDQISSSQWGKGEVGENVVNQTE